MFDGTQYVPGRNVQLQFSCKMLALSFLKLIIFWRAEKCRDAIKNDQTSTDADLVRLVLVMLLLIFFSLQYFSHNYFHVLRS